MPVPNNITDLSTTPAANSPAGSETPSLIDDYLRTHASFIAELRDDAQKRGFAVAVAGGAADAITATYSPAVTALTSGMTLFVRAALANTTATPTFSPNGLAAATIVRTNNQPLVAGDIAGAGHWLELQYDTTLAKWVLQNPAKADLPALSLISQNNCRLAKSGANLVLSRFGGKNLVINGVMQTIPSAGVSLAATGLTPSTLYYIYAYMNSGTMTLEASTTGHSTDSATGIEIKTGDATRTLVGMARPITGPAWQDTATQRFVRSWYNRQPESIRNAFTADRTTTSTTLVELNSEIRCEFLVWANEIASISVGGTATISTAGFIRTTIGYDGITVDFSSTSPGGVANAFWPCCYRNDKDDLSEGYHYATVLGLVTSGTGTWLGASFPAAVHLIGTVGV